MLLLRDKHFHRTLGLEDVMNEPKEFVHRIMNFSASGFGFALQIVRLAK
jgi:hypothetical protein